jgi:serine phosphatase RsbU (regulator of sigma subunit)
VKPIVELSGIGSPERDRRLSVSINMFVGYILVGIAIIAGKLSGKININYTEIVILIAIAFGSTLAFTYFLWKRKHIAPKVSMLIFVTQLMLYLLALSLFTYWLDESQYIALIFVLLALTIELPFYTAAENTIVAFSSIICYLSTLCYLYKDFGVSNTLQQEIILALFFMPPFIVLIYVSRQINRQRENIETGKEILKQVNEKLIHANNILRRARNLTDHDMTLASHVQRAFLPETPQDLSDWDVAVYFRPVSNVSGDCYDFYVKEKHLRGVSIYDVSGHGLSSGLLTMIVKPTTMRWFHQMPKHSLGRILSKVNESIVSEFSVLENYITGAILRLEEDQIEYVNAGHPELIIKRAGESKSQLIQDEDTGVKGQPIGLSRNYPYRSISFPSKSGDTLLLYTDCIVEACDNKNRSFGLPRLLESFDNAPNTSANDILDYIMYTFFSNINTEDVEDDITIMILKKH